MSAILLSGLDVEQSPSERVELEYDPGQSYLCALHEPYHNETF